MRTIQPTPEIEAFMADLKGSMNPVIERHPTLGADIMLAVTAQLVGNLIAMLDQTKYTAAEAMDLVSKNITIGNSEALRALLETPAAGEA